MGKQCIDYLGKQFNSITEMCRFHNMTRLTYQNRIKMGWSQKEALTRPREKNGVKNIYLDHESNTFNTQEEMSDYWGVSLAKIIRAKGKEDSWGEAVYKAVHGNYLDHKGNCFKSIGAMCEFHNVTYNTYMTKKNKGLSLEECLTPKPIVKDHLGNVYESINQMCRAYGISRQLYSLRSAKKWTVEDCLAPPNSVAYRATPKIESKYAFR